MNIRPIRTPEELRAVHECAKANNHMLAWPSHVVEKNDYIIGALSFIPSVMVWMNTEKAKVRDSVQMIQTVESMVANSSRVISVPCTLNSPYLQYLPKVGYLDLGKINLFVKGI